MSKRHRHNQSQRQSGQQYNQRNPGYARGRDDDRGYVTHHEEDEDQSPHGQNWGEERAEGGQFGPYAAGRWERDDYWPQEHQFGRGMGYAGPERGRDVGQQSERYGREPWRGRPSWDEDFGRWPRSQQWRPEPWEMDQGRDYESSRRFNEAGYEPGGIDWGRSRSGGWQYGAGREFNRPESERGGRDLRQPESAGTFRNQGQYGPHSGRGPSGYQRSDERIREDICDRLTDHGSIDATEIQITVRGGEVTLQGTVVDRQMKHLAEDVAESVGGVKEVHNQLRVNRSEEGKKKEHGQESEQQRRSTVRT